VPASRFILLIENECAATDPLARQLVRLGIEPIRADGLAEGIEVVETGSYAIGAVLLPADLPPAGIAETIERMRRREPLLPFMAYGKPPDARQRKALRRADVRLALWEGYDEGVLRFQLNRLLSGEIAHVARRSHRAPVHSPVRIRVGGREKPGMLCSLSEGGCFIETPRASMEGARLELAFGLEQRAYEIQGRVAFANVPGNLQRPNLPLGMGVCFENLPRSVARDLDDFVRRRSSALEV
jgi:hypothetical protein